MRNPSLAWRRIPIRTWVLLAALILLCTQALPSFHGQKYRESQQLASVTADRATRFRSSYTTRARASAGKPDTADGSSDAMAAVLKNSAGMEVHVLRTGAVIQRLIVPDRCTAR